MTGTRIIKWTCGNYDAENQITHRGTRLPIDASELQALANDADSGETLYRVFPSPKPMKVYSVNFLLEGKTPYKDLAPVFPDILKMLLEEIGQMPEEEEILQMLIDLNVSDLEQNRKPEGYNRKGKVRLVFPIDRDEFYIKTFIKTQDLTHIAKNISDMLTAAGVKFTTTQNDDVEFN